MDTATASQRPQDQMAVFTPPVRQVPGTVPRTCAPGPSSLPNGTFMCSRCPRPFKSQQRASEHIRSFRHSYKCNFAGCTWSYEAPKDLKRHLNTHNSQSRETFPCTVANCKSKRNGIPMTFARRDLLVRHMRNFH